MIASEMKIINIVYGPELIFGNVLFERSGRGAAVVAAFADKVSLGVHCRKAEEYASAIGVKMRCSFAHKIREIEKFFRTDWYACRFFVGNLIDIFILYGAFFRFCKAKLILEPLKRKTCRLSNAHNMPLIRHSTAEGVDSAHGVAFRLIGMNKNNT